MGKERLMHQRSWICPVMRCTRSKEETSFQLCDEKRYVVYGTYPVSPLAMKAAESREKSSTTSNPAPHEHGEESSTKIGVIVRDGIRLMLGCLSMVVVSSSDGLQDCFKQAGAWLFGGNCFYLRIFDTIFSVDTGKRMRIVRA